MNNNSFGEVDPNICKNNQTTFKIEIQDANKFKKKKNIKKKAKKKKEKKGQVHNASIKCNAVPCVSRKT
jgi:hypothetical protein